MRSSSRPTEIETGEDHKEQHSVPRNRIEVRLRSMKTTPDRTGDEADTSKLQCVQFRHEEAQGYYQQDSGQEDGEN